MLKRYASLILLGSVIASSSYAFNLPFQKHSIKNPQATKVHNNQKSSKTNFTGTWIGTCNYGDGNVAAKWIITNSDTEITVDGEYDGEKFDSNRSIIGAIKSEDYSTAQFFGRTTSRYRWESNNTLSQDSIFMLGEQNDESSTIPLSPFDVMVSTSTMTLKNNQLITETKMKNFSTENGEIVQGKCTFNKIG